MAKNPPRDTRNQRGYYYCDKETELIAFHSVDEVHSEDTGYQGGEHEDD